MAEPILCERTTRRAIARGDLPAYRLGKRGGQLIRLRADDVDRFMRTHTLRVKSLEVV